MPASSHASIAASECAAERALWEKSSTVVTPESIAPMALTKLPAYMSCGR
jgi:hypothetical protein